jgi:hypothetical protein
MSPDAERPVLAAEEVVAEPVDGGRGIGLPLGVSLPLPPNPLAVPRALAGALGDIKAIANGMAVLPQLLEVLNDIDRGVATMADEVTRMRRGVESMDASVEPLAEHLAATKAGIDELGPRLDDMHHVLRPLRRIARRARGGRDLGGGDLGGSDLGA